MRSGEESAADPVRRMWLLVAIAAVASALDYVTTLLGLQRGVGYEINPVIYWTVNIDGWGLVGLIKAAYVPAQATVVWLAASTLRSEPTGLAARAVRCGSWAVAIALTGAAANNAAIIALPWLDYAIPWLPSLIRTATVILGLFIVTREATRDAVA